MASATDRRWSGGTRGGKAGNAFFVGLVRNGGLSLHPFFLFWVSLWFVFFSPTGRRASNELAKRLGRKGGFFWAWRHNYNFGRLLLDKVAILNGLQDKYDFNADDQAIVQNELAKGRGVVILTAHVGSWELMGQMLDYVDVPVNLVMHETAPEEIRRLMSAGRNFNVLHTDGSPMAAASILDALKRGEIVGMMGDRLFMDEGVNVDFLGEPARFPVGPYALAAAAQAPVVYTFCMRTGKRKYHFRAMAAGTPKYEDRRDKRKDHERWARDFAEKLEGYVRDNPRQWCNFYPFWETEAK